MSPLVARDVQSGSNIFVRRRGVRRLAATNLTIEPLVTLHYRALRESRQIDTMIQTLFTNAMMYPSAPSVVSTWMP